MRYCNKYETCPAGLVHSVRKLKDPLLAEIMRVMVSKTGAHHRAYCRLSAIMRDLPYHRVTIMEKIRKGKEKGILGIVKKGRKAFYYPNWLLVYDTLTPRFQKIICDSIPKLQLYVSKRKKKEGVPVIRVTETKIFELTEAQKEAYERGLSLLKDREKLSTGMRKRIKIEKNM